MLMNIGLRGLCLVTAILATPALADARADIQLLQSLQGSWQRHCYASYDGDTRIYREDELKISYTDFHFFTRVYTDDRCSVERTHYSAVVRFVLTGEYFNYKAAISSAKPNPKRVYAINFYPEDSLPAILRLPPLNLIAQVGMELYLGRDYSNESARGERLTKLNLPAPYIRF